MGFLASAILSAVAFIAATIPTINLPGGRDTNDELFPAPPGYLLPWAGGRIHAVTQGEETTFTHNGLAAYGFDFDLNYDTVVAARSGKVALTYDGSNLGGCDPALNIASNYVVIDHGDGTSALYLHLAYDSVQVTAGDIVSRGQALAISGDTGVTCSDDGGPAPHLHFQVQQTQEGHYFTQSLPIAFDDISGNEGVPVEGESYASGNFGRGKPQKIALTPHRAERVFAPKAVPENPLLTEAVPMPPPSEAAPGEDPNSWVSGVQTAVAAGATPTAEATGTETATATPTETYTPTPLPIPSDTPPPAATPTPVPSDTPPPAPSDTPPPPPSATIEPAGGDTPPPALSDTVAPSGETPPP
jgi:murein DD-endopeptidase MepM/ murein hydrolase activator NlpD